MDGLFGFTPTNSLGSASFDVLNMDGIEDPMIDVNKLATLDFEESYFVSALKYIKESRMEYELCKKELYTSIAESGSSVVILESFSDFFSKVKQIIDKFLKFIKSLFQRFLTNLAKLIGSEKYLEKNKKLFDEFKDADKFEFEGYVYTFNPGIPDPTPALDFSSDKIFAPFNSLKAGDSVNITATGISDAIKSLNYNNDYDDFRASVIGKDGKVYESDYANALFRVFRNDADTTSKVEATPLYIHNCKNRYFEYSKVKKETDKEYKRIEDAYKNLEKQVKDISNRNGDLNAAAFVDKLPDDIKGDVKIGGVAANQGITMSSEIMQQIDTFVKVQIDRIQEYSNIHTLAFSAKLDAMKECARQDKNTLYTALSRIQRTDSKRKDA